MLSPYHPRGPSNDTINSLPISSPLINTLLSPLYSSPILHCRHCCYCCGYCCCFRCFCCCDERRLRERSFDIMETQQSTTMHHGGDASRPSIGFPLGTALLLLVIFSLSGFFSCCYHWEKLRSLRRSFLGNPTDQDLHDPDIEIDLHDHPSKPSSNSPELTQKQVSLPVLMPGDQVPKFIALPCPCEPKRPEMVIAVEVQAPAPVVAPRLQQSTAPPAVLLFNHVARFGGVYYEG